MPTTEHLVLCGGLTAPRKSAASSLRLSLHGSSRNVRLEISDISKRLVARIPDVLVDLLEIASYIYAADGAISRGGRADAQMGARWRRKLRLVIPVRLPNLWSSDNVLSALVETLSFASEDDYTFEFEPINNPPAVTDYFEFSDAQEAAFTPDEVVLFSGGPDSLAGAVEELVAHGKSVALVSHRSSPKIAEVQRYLVNQLQNRFGFERIMHVPVWATLIGRLGREPTHRARSFLFAALGTVTARLFQRDRLRIFENGVVSLNLPPVAQVIGARATRTTHPQVLAGFRRLMSSILDRPFDVDNPFLWLTKAEVIQGIARSACSDLIRNTRSCTRVRDMTTLHPHCGSCPQCIDRRFAVIAAALDKEDPEESYKIELFRGEHQPGPDREMALAFVRSASKVNRMTDIEFFAHYGETSRIVGFFPETADSVASRIFDLHCRHAATICGVFDAAIRSHAANLRGGSLPANCLLSLVLVSGKAVTSIHYRAAFLNRLLSAARTSELP